MLVQLQQLLEGITGRAVKAAHTLPQGQVCVPALAQRPQSPAWHMAVHLQRPHCSDFMHSFLHWNLRSWQDRASVVLPHLQL